MSQRVYLFSTCLVEHLYPQVGMDCVALIELAGFEVVLPKYQSCCGQPAFNSGAKGEAKIVARKTIELLSEFDIPVLVPSASCADMLIRHYPEMFRSDQNYHQKALALAKRCHEAITFLLPHLPAKPASEQSPDADKSEHRLHISCSAQRALKCNTAWLEASRLIKDSAGEPAYGHECCGFGGTFSVKAPEISSAMAQDKIKHLSAGQIDQFVSGDCGCLMHLNGYSEKHGIKLRGEHICNALARTYGVSNEQ
jgi:L-lactate dehydrogenase complex protein LldE